MAGASANLQQWFEAARRLQVAGQLKEAEAIYRQILASDPRHVAAMSGLGEIALEAGLPDPARDLFRRALAIRGDFVECWTGLGTALRELEDLDGSVAAYRKAVELDPTNPAVHNNLANALKDGGELAESAAGYRRALELKPDYMDAQLNLGIALLLAGNLQDGFACYELRRELRQPAYPQPKWAGEDLQGRSILLYTRQGLGDVIQFVRYAPMIAARHGNVVVACKPELRRLLEGQPGISRVVLNTDPRPPVDLQCPLLSLPHVFRTTLETIPAKMPYLIPDATAKAYWHERLAQEPPGLKVGLNWAGNPLPRRNRKRTIGLAAMAPLAVLQGVRFYSLQKGPGAEETMPPAGLTLVDWTSGLNDLADTAALIANLNLVITCDTSVAHLAGALGIPVWVGLRFAPDWRWMLGRADSPWYPTMRLFRQPRPGDWTPVITAMTDELGGLRPG
jgi:Flp pilus assembly protein TadD